MSSDCGILYIVATPIGNIADLSFRAVEVLKTVSVIAAEDTRHSRPLLEHYAIKTPLLALHDHNEAQICGRMIERLQGGESIALISDAGTPLLNDPGFQLVRAAKDQALKVTPVPGACALMAALSVSGLPVDQFIFVGFPPRRSQARRKFFAAQVDAAATLIFYESCHRIEASFNDLKTVFPAEREVVVARELTKLFETVIKTTVERVSDLFRQDANMLKGEFVVLVQGAGVRADDIAAMQEYERILSILLSECALKTAVTIAVKMTGARKKLLYDIALRIKGGS